MPLYFVQACLDGSFTRAELTLAREKWPNLVVTNVHPHPLQLPPLDWDRMYAFVAGVMDAPTNTSAVESLSAIADRLLGTSGGMHVACRLLEPIQAR